MCFFFLYGQTMCDQVIVITFLMRKIRQLNYDKGDLREAWFRTNNNELRQSCSIKLYKVLGKEKTK